MNLRRLVGICLLASLLGHPCIGQEASDSVTVGLKKGSWSLQFRVAFLSSDPGGSFSLLDPFEGGVLSAKLHITDNSAFRASLGFVRDDIVINSRIRIEERAADMGGFEDSGSSSRRITDLWMLDASLLYLRYVQLAPSNALYLGAGPGYRLNLDDEIRSNSRSSDQGDNSFTLSRTSSIVDLWGSGIHFVLGAEWFITSSLSVVAEYHSKLFYEVFDITMDSELENAFRISNQLREDKIRRFSFEAQPVRLGVSFYF